MANVSTKKDDKGSFGQVASDIKDKVQDAASSAADKAKDIGSSMAKTADAAVGTVGENVKSLGSTIRQNTPNEGYLGAASNAVADTVEGTGRYLSEHGITGAAEDFTNLIRQHPIPAVLIGIGIGFLLARATRS